MDADLYARANNLLLEVLALPAEERTSFLDNHCECEKVRREVDSLLAAESDSGLLEPAVDWLADDIDSEARLGLYTIEKELGRGGMGVVYQARRADGEFDRQVAIKVLKRGTDTDAVVRRFLKERQILASLQHPNIAALLDGGTAPDRRPYLVMELVQGQPIDRFCLDRGLDIRAKVELILDVCEALQFAHQHLVVHRDIKPSNILVDEEGRPKLLDFGIAKILDPNDPASPTATAAGHAPMTLGYASPEQIEGLAVGTATDIYGLAAVLYELLTGERPFQRSSDFPGELRRAILERVPEGLDTVASRSPHHAADASKLRGDLDAVVQKALAKELSDRYASCESFTRDLRAFLDGRPVLARPNTSLYLGLRFIRRHRQGVLLAMAALLALVIFAVDRTIQHRETVRHKERAERTLHFVLDLLELPGDLKAADREALKGVLDRGREDLKREFTSEPLVKAELLKTLGKSYLGLELAEPAEESFLAAIDHFQNLGHRDDLQVGGLLFALAYTAQDLGRFDVAKDRARRALEIFEKELGSDHETTANAQEFLGLLEMRLGDYEAAETYLRQVLELKLRLYGEANQNTLNGMAHLGLLLNRRGQTAEAESLLRRALEKTSERYGASSGMAINMQTNLVAILNAQGKHREAAPLAEGLIRHRRLANAPRELPNAVNNFAMLKMYVGETEKAAELSREAVDLSIQNHGPKHVSLIALKANLAKLEHRLGRLQKAEDLARNALELGLSELGANHTRTAYARLMLASILIDLSRPAEAVELARPALETLRQQLRPGSWKLARAEAILGRGLLEVGQAMEGGSLLRSGFEGLAAPPRSDGFRLRRAAEALIEHYERTGQPVETRRIRQRLKSLEAHFPAAA